MRRGELEKFIEAYAKAVSDFDYAEDETSHLPEYVTERRAAMDRARDQLKAALDQHFLELL